MQNSEKTMEKIVALCKGRGFVYPGSEIYGGLANSWDYGPLGVELKENIKKAWRKKFIQENPYNVGLDSAILMNPQTWVASGHLGGFSDPLMDCCECKTRHRADDLIENFDGTNVAGWSNEEMSAYIKEHNIPCPNCGAHNFTDIRQFNLMFKTFQGVTEDAKDEIYLRPETAQGIFVNFKNVQRTSRKKIPFGIGQIGKSFRNEITPRMFTFRSREFEQMEMEYFCKPGTEDETFARWRKDRWNFYLKYGIAEDHLNWHHHDKLAHYAKDAYDIQYKFPIGFEEIEGIHSRTDFDLSQHEQYSKKDMHYIDQDDANKRYIPYVVETSAGLNRNFLMFLCEAYEEQNVAKEGESEDFRTVLHLDPRLAPVTVAVLPLMKKDGLAEKAKEIQHILKEDFVTDYDQSGTIGKRYRRQDEIGTPFCVTVDHDTLDSSSADFNTVTVRFRDSMEQKRVPLDDLIPFIQKEIKSYVPVKR
ncbi:MAG TPA: glycine--tRNA ligase [Treponema sp.]|nr:glycine--tRNA ligase [Treponema sp.]